MRYLLIAVLVAAAGLLLSACDDHEGEVCVHKSEVYLPPTYVQVGKVLVPVGGGMVSECDQWAKAAAR